MTDSDRTPPQDVAAEQSVLGGMLLSAAAADDVPAVLDARDFYVPRHETVFAAITALRGVGQPADAVTVAAWLQEHGELAAIGGHAYLHTLLSSVPTAASAGYYARIVHERAVLRRLVMAGTRIVQLGYATDGGDIHEITAAAEAEVEAVTTGAATDSSAVRVGDIFDGYLERLEEPDAEEPGVAWHTADLRRNLRPIAPGRLAVIAAWSGIGKSIAAWNYACNAALREKRRVLMHSIENTRDETIDRLIAAEARVDLSRVTERWRGEGHSRHFAADWDRIAPVRGRIEDAELFIDDDEYVTLSTLRASVRRHKPDVLIVDQIPIMQPPDPKAPREQQVAAIAYGLKRLAKAEGIGILAVAQLNDDALKRTDKRPGMHDLRESRTIVHAADAVVILHDESHLEPESPRAGEIDYIIAKQRNGRKTTVTLANQVAYARHVDMAS